MLRGKVPLSQVFDRFPDVLVDNAVLLVGDASNGSGGKVRPPSTFEQVHGFQHYSFFAYSQ